MTFATLLCTHISFRLPFHAVPLQMVSRHRYAFMLPFVLATWAFLAQTILFSMKCDGLLEKSVSWMLVWTPMWFVDLLLLIIVAISFPEFVNIEGESIELKSTPVFVKIFNAVHLASFVLFQVLLFLKLDTVIDWNWFFIFSPWLFYEGVLFVKYIYANFVPTYESINYFDTESLRKCINHFLRAWLAVFIALKLNHQNEWSWGFILLPVWMYLGVNVLWSCVYTYQPGVYSVTSGVVLFITTVSWIWIPTWLVHCLEVSVDQCNIMRITYTPTVLVLNP